MLETERRTDYMDVGSRRDELYEGAARDFGPALERLAAGYEADAEKRRDLLQEIHFQLWRSLELFDERCSLKTWTFRVAHNSAVTWVNKERRNYAALAGLEDIEPAAMDSTPDIDHERALQRLSELIRTLKPLDRQIMLSYLEEMDAAAIAEITGLSSANVAMKIHRIKTILARQFAKEQRHA